MAMAYPERNAFQQLRLYREPTNCFELGFEQNGLLVGPILLLLHFPLHCIDLLLEGRFQSADPLAHLLHQENVQIFETLSEH